MATAVLKVPGVYRQERPERSRPVLPTGVPAFVGLVQTNAPVPAGAPLTANGYGPVALRRKADFPGGAAAYLEHAVSGFFDNGGDYCYVVAVRADAVPGRRSCRRAHRGTAITELAERCGSDRRPRCRGTGTHHRCRQHHCR